MKRLALGGLLLVLSTNFVPVASGRPHENPKIYLAPQGGFETYLAAAFTKKHLAATIVSNPDEADYVLEAAPVEHKPESTGSKVARCLFVYCAGMEGTESASV